MPSNILAVGAHLDDAFIGAGGVLLQAVAAGCRVAVVSVVSDFSTRAKTRGQEDETVKDLVALCDDYGFEHHLLGRGYHQIDAGDMALKREISEIAVDVQPDVAFIHHNEDLWPDHVACAKLGFDAVMFTHGLSSDPTQRYCPLVYSFDLTPRQTYSFEPDAFYDVSDVIDDYVRLILEVDCIGNRAQAEELVRATFQSHQPEGPSMELTTHGMLRLADCIRFGDLSDCPFALGFKTVWGTRHGDSLW